MISKMFFFRAFLLSLAFFAYEYDWVTELDIPEVGTATYEITMSMGEELAALPEAFRSTTPNVFDTEVELYYAPDRVVSNGSTLMNGVMSAVLGQGLLNDDMFLTINLEDHSSQLSLEIEGETFYMEKEIQDTLNFESEERVATIDGKDIYRAEFTHNNERFSILYMPQVNIPYGTIPVAITGHGLVLELKSEHFEVKLKSIEPVAELAIFYELPKDATEIGKEEFGMRVSGLMQSYLQSGQAAD